MYLCWWFRLTNSVFLVTIGNKINREIDVPVLEHQFYKLFWAAN